MGHGAAILRPSEERAEEEPAMPLAAVARAARMSGPEFRAFQAARPDHERWELIAGVPVMMTPPLMEHNVIATNLQTLLNAALRNHDESRYAVQRPGIEFPWPRTILAEMERNGAYRPEPDVAVVEYDDVVGGKRFTDRAYLLAEVVSSTDEDLTPVSGERWIDVKVRLHQAHAPCEAIVVAEQERVHVTVHLRTAGGWTCRVLAGLDDEVAIPSAGLACPIADLYRDTRWHPRRARADRPRSPA